MFTGIVSAVGRIVSASPLGDGGDWGRSVTVETPPRWLDGSAVGDSILVAGACMTIVALDDVRFTFEVSAESLACTSGLDGLGEVNLEKAMRAGDRLDGHLVSGHVDGVGRVAGFDAVGESHELAIDAPPALARFIAAKGSIAVDGTSLTVNRVTDLGAADGGGCRFTINVIAHTLAQTTLKRLAPGAAVNLEIDLVARYVERLLGSGARVNAGS